MEGQNSPSTMADDATVGTVAWTNPDNAKVSDGVYASMSGSHTSHFLKATNFGFSIPSGATINGILVEVEKLNGDANAVDNSVKIVKADGTFGTTNKADTATNWAYTDTYVSYGSSSDLWGETWAYSDINDVDFGVAFSGTSSGPGAALFVDHIRITVYYTAGGNAMTFTGTLNISGTGI